MMIFFASPGMQLQKGVYTGRISMTGWKSSQPTIYLPKALAVEEDLNESCVVLILKTEDGILIRRLKPGDVPAA
jgi:hypothetical protein